MSDKFPPVMQRPRLLALASTLEISITQLRRDDCGDWAIIGNSGRVYAVLSGFQIVIAGWEADRAPWSTAKGWNLCKSKLSFAKLMQDGHDEGAFVLERDPRGDEAAIIRECVGLRKRRAISEDGLAALRSRLAAFRAA